MKWRDIAIVRKLGLVLVLNTLLAVSMIAGVFTVGTAIGRYHDTQSQLLALAQVVGENSRAALAFQDRESAQLTLQALHMQNDVESARLFDVDGVLFAEVSFTARHDHIGSTLERVMYSVLPSGVDASHEIVEDGRVVGRIEVHSHLLHIWLELLKGQALMVVIGAVLATLSVLYSLRLRHIVSDPILALKQITNRVSQEQDYSIRAAKSSNDEIGDLVVDFNHMLAEIQGRDAALQRERESLEQRTLDMMRARDEAQRANKVKSEFLSTVSHELRTPLTAITGTVGLIAGGALGPLPQQAAQMLQIAQKNCQRLTFLINDLLDMEKLMAGKLHFDLQAHDIVPLVEQALVDNQAYAEQYGVTYVLTHRIEGALVEVDPQRLQQVLANLLSNAAKFSPVGLPVEVSVQLIGEKVRINVRDRGAGIPAEFHARIFQKFSQADASDTRQKGGTGLGLAITRELVECMGGQVGFDSTPGEGACFHFELPLWTASSLAPATLPAAPQERGGPRVLVVEDDPDVARFLSLMLTQAGYSVDAAPSAEQALALAVQGGYAAITLDLNLPDMNGQQLIHRLRSTPETQGIPIMVVAARANDGLAEALLEAPDLVLQAKPIDPPRLLSTLQHLISGTALGQMRVLHVEDDADLHNKVLSMAGDRFDFEFASNLREARARVALERFDAVILDLALPNEESGWDLLPAIRSCQPQARVVVLSTSELTPDDACQVDAVLRKSQVSARQLVDAISAPPIADQESGVQA